MEVAKEEPGRRSVHHLLREQITAERNSPAEQQCREIRAMGPLALGPGLQRRDQYRQRGAQQAEKPVIRGDGAKFSAFLRTVRAEFQQLHHPRKVVRRRGMGNAGNIHDFLRQASLVDDATSERQ